MTKFKVELRKGDRPFYRGEAGEVRALPDGGQVHLLLTYQAALDEKYLWHEFGDLHLIFDFAVTGWYIAMKMPPTRRGEQVSITVKFAILCH